MVNHNGSTRRGLIKNSLFGLMAASVPGIVFSKNYCGNEIPVNNQSQVHDRYPAIKLEIASEVVGAAHFDLDKLKKLVDTRPELANAVWDFGFGDWESAIAAASHVGRVDIVNYLVSKGATPTIFTYAMLGNYNVVKAMIASVPGLQKALGPHGISLLQHAKTGLLSGNENVSQSRLLVAYLEQLGDADGNKYLTVEESEKEKYLGDYIFNPETGEGFTVKLNMRKLLSLGRKGKNGGAIHKIENNIFTYNGAPSVTVTFNIEKNKVVSLTIKEPGIILTAKKQS